MALNDGNGIHIHPCEQDIGGKDMPDSVELSFGEPHSLVCPKKRFSYTKPANMPVNEDSQSCVDCGLTERGRCVMLAAARQYRERELEHGDTGIAKADAAGLARKGCLHSVPGRL